MIIYFKRSSVKSDKGLNKLVYNLPRFQAAVSMLKQEYKEDKSLQSGLELAIKVLSKTLDTNKLTDEKGKSDFGICHHLIRLYIQVI